MNGTSTESLIKYMELIKEYTMKRTTLNKATTIIGTFIETTPEAMKKKLEMAHDHIDEMVNEGNTDCQEFSDVYGLTFFLDWQLEGFNGERTIQALNGSKKGSK